MSQVFGKWPVPCFLEMPAEAQTLFWQQSQEVKQRASLQTLLIKHVSDFRIDVHTSRSGGNYLPLSVYKTQGYTDDMLDNIAENSVHKWDAELNAEVFKLVIASEFKDDIHKKVAGELSTFKMGGDLRDGLKNYKSPAKNTKKRNRSSSSSSRSSSAGSSKSEEKVDPKKVKVEQAKSKAKAKAKAKAEATAKLAKAKAEAAAKLAKAKAEATAKKAKLAEAKAEATEKKAKLADDAKSEREAMKAAKVENAQDI